MQFKSLSEIDQTASGPQAFARLTLRTVVDAELRRLREEVRILRIEKDIFFQRRRISQPFGERSARPTRSSA